MIEFWGVQVPGKKTIDVEVTNNESAFEIVHVTNVALGAQPTAGPHAVAIIYDGKEVVLGTLDQSRVSQFGLDFGCTKSFKLKNYGTSAAHIAGFKTRSMLEDQDDDEFSDDEYSDDEDVPMAVPMGRKVGCSGSSGGSGHPAACGPVLGHLLGARVTWSMTRLGAGLLARSCSAQRCVEHCIDGYCARSFRRLSLARPGGCGWGRGIA